MKMNQNLTEQEILVTNDSNVKMRLSENSAKIVFEMFTKNIYSNPIGSIAREITSNCFDSHIEAGNVMPVIIKKSKDSETNTNYISFIDFGVGMSPERVNNIYGVYFESTKKETNTQIGGFGIGGKTPLAYRRQTGAGEGDYDNSFYVITIFNNVKYYYCIYQGTESPIISLLHKENTTDRNGTEIKIPVLQQDLKKFEYELLRQLYYFENVVFEGFENHEVTNDYNIYQSKTFLYRGTEYSNYIHVCLGKVAYPIDYKALNLNQYDYEIPVAIKLNIGDVNVTVSRESLDYSQKTITILKNKLEEVKKEIQELLIKQYENVVTLKDYYQVIDNFGKLILDKEKDIKIKTGSLIPFSSVSFTNFKYNVLKLPEENRLFNILLSIKSYGKKVNYRNRYEGGLKGLNQRQNVFYTDNEFNRNVKLQGYLNKTYGKFYVIVKNDLNDQYLHGDKLRENFGYNLKDSTINSLIEIQNDYMKIFSEKIRKYEDIIIPESFKIKRKITDKEIKNQTIVLGFFRNGSLSRKADVKIEYLLNYKMPIYYGTYDDEHLLCQASDIHHDFFDKKSMVHKLNGKRFENDYYHYYANKKPESLNSIMFIGMSKANLKYMSYCKNAIPVKNYAHTMLYRKESLIKKHFENLDIINKLGDIEIPHALKDDVLKTVAPLYADIYKKYDDLTSDLYANKKSFNENNIFLKKLNIKTNVTLSKELNEMIKEFDLLKTFIEFNNQKLKFVSRPYNAEYNNEYINFIKTIIII